MGYRVRLGRAASRALETLPAAVRTRIAERLEAMRVDPYRGARKIQGDPGFRLRVGDYRVLYDVDDTQRTVLVWRIAHRREAYR